MSLTQEQQTRRVTALMVALGWQGGTIHQLAEAIGCGVNALLDNEADYDTYYMHGKTTNVMPTTWLFPSNNRLGNIQFWIGMADRINEKGLNSIYDNLKFPG